MNETTFEQTNESHKITYKRLNKYITCLVS